MSEPQVFRVMALHALEYCERLFYLEEVEEIRVADARVYAGRTLHAALDEDAEFVELTMESETLRLKGKIDALRQRTGLLLPYEHKRGRAKRVDGNACAWSADRLQVAAYGLLLEEVTGEPVAEGRIRYHADNVVVRVPMDEALRASVANAVRRASLLSRSTERPPVTEHEGKCTHCSLAPICLPEESRKVLDHRRRVRRLHPRDDDRLPVHVLGHRARVGRSAHELVVKDDDSTTKFPIRRVRSVSVHGYGSVTAQALTLCSDHGVAVHWFGPGGRYRGTFCRDDDAVQRRIRQYEALRQPAFCVSLARRLVAARIEGQLRFLLRATRGHRPAAVESAVRDMRILLKKTRRQDSRQSLLGFEGRAARLYFGALPLLFAPAVDERLVPQGRTKRPPRDAFNALLGFGYGMLIREVVQAIRGVGLDGAFGFYHQPRSAAPPLALDLMELFRVPVIDLALVGAVNRRQFGIDRHFRRAGEMVWLNSAGRKLVIDVVERRMNERWRHPVLKYSLSYRRHIELEVRLLEKEWSGDPGLFGRARLR